MTDDQAATSHTKYQLVRFFVGGLATIAADYGTFHVLFAVGAPLFVATTASLLAGFVVSFTLNKLWVFGATKERGQKNTTLQLVLYTALFLFNIGFAYLFIQQLQLLGVSAYLGKLLSIVLIVAWNFVIYKKIIFARALPEA